MFKSMFQPLTFYCPKEIKYWENFKNNTVVGMTLSQYYRKI